MDEIKVSVVVRRGKFFMRYLDPMTGRYVERSAKSTTRSDAIKAAGKWQAELNEGRYAKQSKMTWPAFREYYAAHMLPALAPGTRTTYESTVNVFERTCNPKKLADVTTARVTHFVTEARNKGLTEATIARHLRGLKAIMRWAHREGLLNVVPKFTMPKRVKGSKVMRGRAVTTEEFERMLEIIPKVVENIAAASWTFYLNGLWLSGLRLSESLALRWDVAPDAIVVDFSGRRPMFRIPSEAEKGNQDRLLPMTPDFAKLLESVPERDRHGRVFKLLGINGSPLHDDRFKIGPMAAAIGKAAGVVVDERKKGDKIVKKFASAHDLRRAFAVRWSSKVMPTVLRELMRHESIETTMKYYVGQNAEATADAVWAASSIDDHREHPQEV